MVNVAAGEAKASLVSSACPIAAGVDEVKDWSGVISNIGTASGNCTLYIMNMYDSIGDIVINYNGVDYTVKKSFYFQVPPQMLAVGGQFSASGKITFKSAGAYRIVFAAAHEVPGAPGSYTIDVQKTYDG